MATLTYPGVYIQEVSSGIRPIEVASTSTAAFVGFAEMGPEHAQRITNWTEFQRYYGGFIADSFLAESVFQYFNNGGRQCYIVRVTRGDAAAADVTVLNRAATPIDGVLFSAKSKGTWGNDLYLQIDDGTSHPGDEFRIAVWRGTDPAAAGATGQNAAPAETFDNLSADPKAANFVGKVLEQNSNLIDAQVLPGNVSFQKGTLRGGFDPILPLNNNLGFQINLDNDGFQPVALPSATGNSTDLAAVAAAIQAAVQGLTKKKPGTPATTFSAFACTVETVNGKSRLLLQSGTEGAGSSVRVQPAAANDASVQLKLGAGGGAWTSDALAARRPANARSIRLGQAGPSPASAATGGTDGDLAQPVTESLLASGFARLDTLTDFSLLAVPGYGSSVMMDLGMAYCANRPLQDVFYVGEMVESDDTADEAAAFRAQLTTPNSYGAVYFPWIRALDPSGRSAAPVLLPPAGYVAGLYARIDASRGVWKAPAGTEASLSGAVGLAAELNDVQQGNLNPIGVNVIRRFPGAGIVAFGARTVSSDPEWKYVPVRRMAIMLRVSIYNGIQWAVFEPNDEPLWSQLRLNIGSFMMTLFRQGAFQGSTPSQAFFVKCDAETTTQADIDLGIVNILVGFAPLKPAEFVVVKLSQKAGQAQ